MIVETFADRLCRLRIRAGLTVAELAVKSTLPRQTIHKLERGQRQPSFATVCKLADALEISVEKFRGNKQ